MTPDPRTRTIAPGKGNANVERPALRPEEDYQYVVRHLRRLCLNRIARLGAEIEKLDKRIIAATKENGVARRRQTMPVIGPVCAMAITGFASDMHEFRRERDMPAFAAERIMDVEIDARAGAAKGVPSPLREDQGDGYRDTRAGRIALEIPKLGKGS
ncbi:hypothetical protein SAMN04488105_10770 [Salipiger thiooxidans]|uniref:Transposase IS116/IS110/IS902 family protein n=1 Tax=Salipiger thiooxidans TaxID=282683 RepID=A0A1G7FH59_9RHOB|nr:hypothetical protein SAMN04488105_10770 [Salipiger thiooxidans]